MPYFGVWNTFYICIDIWVLFQLFNSVIIFTSFGLLLAVLLSIDEALKCIEKFSNIFYFLTFVLSLKFWRFFIMSPVAPHWSAFGQVLKVSKICVELLYATLIFKPSAYHALGFWISFQCFFLFFWVFFRFFLSVVPSVTIFH